MTIELTMPTYDGAYYVMDSSSAFCSGFPPQYSPDGFLIYFLQQKLKITSISPGYLTSKLVLCILSADAKSIFCVVC